MPQTTTEPLVQVEGLHVHFARRPGLLASLLGRSLPPVRAVDGVDLTIHRGEILALVGESGSGKTTLGRALLRLVEPTAGRVVFAGQDVTRARATELRAFRRRAQMIFQDPYESLNPRQTVREIVREPLDVHGLGRDEQDRLQRVVRSLEDVELRPAVDYLDRYPHELSGGQRQRVAIAAALVLDPEFIVADEPVSMLDVSIRAEILRVLLDLRNRRGLTFLFVTHDLSLAWLIADRVAVMYLGRIVEIGPADEVIRNPQHPYTRALVRVIPRPRPGARGHGREVLAGEPPNPAEIPAGCRFHRRCPLAFDRCFREDPALVPVSPGALHWAACHLVRAPGEQAGI